MGPPEPLSTQGTSHKVLVGGKGGLGQHQRLLKRSQKDTPPGTRNMRHLNGNKNGIWGESVTQEQHLLHHQRSPRALFRICTDTELKISLSLAVDSSENLLKATDPIFSETHPSARWGKRFQGTHQPQEASYELSVQNSDNAWKKCLPQTHRDR